MIILGYFISAIPAPKKKFGVPFMSEIQSLCLSLDPNIEIIVLQGLVYNAKNNNNKTFILVLPWKIMVDIHLDFSKKDLNIIK